MLNVIMLNVVTVSVIMLNVVMLGVIVPCEPILILMYKRIARFGSQKSGCFGQKNLLRGLPRTYSAVMSVGVKNKKKFLKQKEVTQPVPLAVHVMLGLKFCLKMMNGDKEDFLFYFLF